MMQCIWEQLAGRGPGLCSVGGPFHLGLCCLGLSQSVQDSSPLPDISKLPLSATFLITFSSSI